MDQNTVRTLVKVYAVLAWLGAAGLLLIAGILFVNDTLLMQTIADMMETNPEVAIVNVTVFRLLGSMFIAMAAFYTITGIGLWRTKNWGRICALIISVFSLLSFPFGIIIGGFGIYLFGFEENSKAVFAEKIKKKMPTKKRKK